MKKKEKKINHTVLGSTTYSFSWRFIAFSVFLVQLLLPVSPAFADEIESASVEESQTENSPSETAVSEVISESDEVEVVQSSEETTSDASPLVVDDVGENMSPDQDVPSGTSDDESILEDQSPVAAEESVSPEEAVTYISDDTSATESDSSGETEDLTLEDSLIGTTTSETLTNEESAQEEVEDTTASTTETAETTDATDEPVLPVPEVDSAASSTVAVAPTTTGEAIVVEPLAQPVPQVNGYVFSMEECARVADGSFYCSPESNDETQISDRVYAAPDQDGDSEIFIIKDGVTTQLTHNTSDDAAPFYDYKSETIVFHRLVDARYQIVSLALETRTETQLTFDSYNNMQPSRYGDYIVWQGWVGNDWEVLLWDSGEVEMITDNATHDIGPRINGEYVIWQVETEDGWQVRVYNMLTGMAESIDDTDGASIENPRLVLVYDAKHENGDIETRGYDLVSGKNIALHSEAEKLPEELPDPDTTGEDSALLIGSAQLKTKTEEDDLDQGTSTDDGLVTDGSGDEPSAATSTTDIVVPDFSNTDQGTTTEEIVQEIEEPETLVIAPLDTTHTEIDIPDLVIPPLEIVPIDTDPQEAVAERE